MKLGWLNHIGVATQPKPLPGGEGLGWGTTLGSNPHPNPSPQAKGFRGPAQFVIREFRPAAVPIAAHG